MTLGPGVYDDLCTEVREKAKAEGAVIMVIKGERGSGFSIQANPQLTLSLPSILRQIADTIDGDLETGGEQFFG